MTHQHHERRVLPFTPRQLFDLVMDIEVYPRFLPWCRRARIFAVDEEAKSLEATVSVGYKLLNEQFSCKVTYSEEEPYQITVTYLSGPLTALENRWQFLPHKDGCEVVFDVQFGLESSLLSKFITLIFDKAVHKMVAAFEGEARRRYNA